MKRERPGQHDTNSTIQCILEAHDRPKGQQMVCTKIDSCAKLGPRTTSVFENRGIEFTTFMIST